MSTFGRYGHYGRYGLYGAHGNVLVSPVLTDLIQWLLKLPTNFTTNELPDNSGNLNIGKPVGSPAIELNGTDQDGEIQDSESKFNWGSADFAINQWFKTTSTTSSTMLDKYYSIADERSWAVNPRSTGILRFYTSTGSGPDTKNIDTIEAFNDGEWHNLYILKSGVRASLLVDGEAVQITNGELNETLGSFSNNCRIGSNGDVGSWSTFDGGLFGLEMGKVQKNIDLYIFDGQSNMRGVDTDTASLGASDSYSCHFYAYHTNDGSSSDEVVRPISRWGSEVSFASRIFEQTRAKIAIVKTAEGGVGFGSGEWVKGGSLYEDSVSRVLAAKALLESRGYTVTIKGMAWMQGENDTRSTEWAEAYYDEFVQFHADFTNDIGVSELPVAMGRIHDDLPTGGFEGRYDYSAEVRAQQDLLGELDYITIIDTDEYPLNVDSVHFSGAGQVEFGNDIANVFADQATDAEYIKDGDYINSPLSERVGTSSWNTGASDGLPSVEWNSGSGNIEDMWDEQDLLHYSFQYGCTIYTHATLGDIAVPYGQDSNPLTITPPAGYTKAYDIPAGNYLGDYGTKFIQDDSNPDAAELLTIPFWSADGITFDAKSWDDFIAYVSGTDNLWLKFRDVNGLCVLDETAQYLKSKTFTESEYNRMLAWRGGVACGNGVVPFEIVVSEAGDTLITETSDRIIGD